MPRWEDGSEDRLKQAALELFGEQGFENTSVVEIAKRARVATRTYFRYFSDKREVLFSGADALGAVLAERIFQAPDIAQPLALVTRVLAEFDWESLGSREHLRRRHAVIAANPDLLERDLIKHQSIAVGITDALRRRGVEAGAARLAAGVGTEIFLNAYRQWLEAGDEADLPTITLRTLSCLATIVPGGWSVATDDPG